MMKQYLEIKQDNPDSILFFRLGDFYEMFADDARLASKELDLTLTSRDKDPGKPAEERIPMCGIPYHASEAYIARLMRSSMLDVLGQDYMRTARAKGLGQFKCIFKHALRNAVLPVVTYLGPLLAYTLTGSFVVEKIFTIPGLGSEFVGSITGRDYPLIMGTTIFLAVLIVSMNVIVDIAYKLIDPRIKLK